MSDVVSGMEPEGVPRLFVQSCVAPCSRNRRLLIVIHTRASSVLAPGIEEFTENTGAGSTKAPPAFTSLV